MDYDPSGFAGEEGLAAAEGQIYLECFDPTDQKWENAIYGNIGANSDRFYLGAWPNGDLTIGDWGVNTANHTVWAVVDHNSEFAVVPEPGTVALLAAGAIGLAGYGLRRRAARSAKPSTFEQDAPPIPSFPSHSSPAHAARRAA